MTRRSSPPHRTPDRLGRLRQGGARGRLQGDHAGAGGAAHLPGMTAAFTPLPVFGVPVASKALSGQDSLLSIVQMPAGVPVGTLAIGEPGAVNAALLAAAVLALSDGALADRLDAWRAAPHEIGGRPAERRGNRPAMILAPGATIGILGAGSLAGCWRWPREAGLAQPFVRARSRGPRLRCRQRQNDRRL